MGCCNNPPYYISAYSLAVKQGYVGTLNEWLQSLSAYGIALKNGFIGTEEAWLQSLVGGNNIAVGSTEPANGTYLWFDTAAKPRTGEELNA